MKKRTFPVKEVGDFYNKNFINVNYDMEKAEGIRLKELFPDAIKAYPTLLFIDQNSGKITHKVVGNQTPKQLITEGETMLAGVGLEYLQAQIDTGVYDFNLFKEYINMYYNSGERDQSTELVEAYYEKNETDKSLLDKDKFDFYFEFVGNIDSKLYSDIVRNRYNLIRNKLVSQDDFNDHVFMIIRIASSELFKLKRNEGEVLHTLTKNDELYKILSRYIKEFERDNEMQEHIVQKYIYDNLLSEDFDEVRNAVKYANLFGFKGVSDFYYSTCACYIANYSKDNNLKKILIKDIEEMQVKGEKKLPHFNLYRNIAFIYDNIGDKKSANMAKKKYEDILEKREKQFNRPNLRKKK